ncbi:MAG: DUF2273 domain-containing protein [Firmicutes bacterium]|nr:DUF2273 domain-containing protein [Bacillota bacterium]
MDERISVFVAWLLASRGRIVGTGLGILLGLFTLKYGFLKAVFLLFCLTAGYMVGAKVDRQGGARALLDEIFPRGRRK